MPFSVQNQNIGHYSLNTPFKLIMDLPSSMSYFPSSPMEIPQLAVSKALLNEGVLHLLLLPYQLKHVTCKEEI